MNLRTLAPICWFAALLLAAPAFAQDQTDQGDLAGTVEITTTSFSIGIGGSWGDGVLTLTDGRRYPFTVNSFDVGSVALSSITASGEVYDLPHDNLQAFTGRYLAASSALSIGAGMGGSVMRNQHGVTMTLVSTQLGVQATFGTQGLNIELSE